MSIEELKNLKLKGLKEMVENGEIGDLKKLNIYYNGNEEARCLLYDFSKLLKDNNLKCIAYVYCQKGYRIPEITLYIVDKNYEKPRFQKDCEYITCSEHFMNSRNIGVKSQQYRIIKELYEDIENWRGYNEDSRLSIK